MNTKAGLLLVVSVGLTTSVMAQSVWETIPEEYNQPQSAARVIQVPATNAAQAPVQATPQVVSMYGTSAFAKSLYQYNEGRPFWTGVSQSNLRAFLSFLPSISRHGLNVNDYRFRDLLQLQTVDALSFENQFTEEVIKLMSNVSVGRINPRTVATNVKFTLRKFDNVQSAYRFMSAPNARNFDLLAPQHPQYRNLLIVQRNLVELNARGGFPGIPKSSKTLKVGVTDPLVLEIKKRLNVLGYNLRESDFFDEEMKTALKEVQIASSVENTGELNTRSNGTWAYFAVDSFARQQQVELTLEKLRWLPKDLGVRHIFVNTAIQELTVVDPDLDSTSPVLLMKTINGTHANQTPTFADNVTNVVINPKWRVPPGIMAGEKIPRLLGLYAAGGPGAISDWLYTNRFRLVDRANRDLELDPYSIDWTTVTADNYTFQVVQDSGEDNALGVLKINLTNKHGGNIYLHDTDNRSLFARFKRLLSHGCVRIHKPLELAAYLLEGSRQAMTLPDLEGRVSTGYERKDERFIPVAESRKLPVYFMPVTTFTRGGRVQFTNDVYDQNAKLLRALKKAGFYRASAIDARVE